MRTALILILFLLPLFNTVSAELTFNDTDVWCNTDNDNVHYNVSHVLDFTEITIETDYVEFNDTRFYIDSLNDIEIGLDHLDLNMIFYVDTASGNAWFNISNFNHGIRYLVRRNNIFYMKVDANETGYVRFDNDDWNAPHKFEISVTTSAPSVITFSPPGLTGMVVVMAIVGGLLALPFYVLWRKKRK